MPLKTLLYFICLAIIGAAFTSRLPVDLPPLQEVAFADLHREGKAPGRHVRLDGGLWLGDAYTELLQFSVAGVPAGKKVAAIYLPLVDGKSLSGEKTELRVIYSPEVPQGLKPEQLSDSNVLRGLFGDSVEGCIKPFTDEDMIKQLVDDGYQPRQPMLQIAPCAQPSKAEPVTPWTVFAGLFVAFGSYRFVRLFRRCFVVRKEEKIHADGALLPESMSAEEALRVAKAGFGRWQLYRESFLDAAMFYAPALLFFRLKTSIPLELAKTSGGALMQLLRAKKEGRLREHLRQLAQDRLIFSANLVGLVVMLELLGLGMTSDVAIRGLVGMVTAIGIWILAAKYLQLGSRKGLSVAFVSAMLIGMMVQTAPQMLLKEGVFINLPYLEDYAQVIRPDLLAFPWVIPFAMLSYVAVTFLFRGILRYFSGGATLVIGGRKVKVAEKEE